MKQKMNAVLTGQVREIAAWFQGSIGKQVIQTETAIMDELLEEMFGYHMLQLSI
ncbi:uncharacterized protein METZ01_LOCUS230466, partial [marine metagenome]